MRCGEPVLRSRPSARRLWPPGGWAALGLVLTAGCGRVEFGEDLVPPEDLDDGTDARVADAADAGTPLDTPDAGPPVDAGCLPVEIPEGPGDAWPFARTESAYREVFYDAVAAGCTGTAGSVRCHGGGMVPPLIPFPDRLSSQYEEAIDALWPLIASAPRLDRNMPSGALWRHLPNHPSPAPPPFSDPSAPALIDGLLAEARDCNVARVLSSPPDSGVDCSAPPPEMDLGAPGGDTASDAAAVDGGRPDGSSDLGARDAALDAGLEDASLDAGEARAEDAGPTGGGGGSCYCPIPDVGPLMTTMCAL